jgi:trigger factor
MTTSVREVGPFERVITFDLSEAEIGAAMGRTARRLSRELKLKGFRPGKAPRPVVEAAVGADRLRSETVDDLVPERLQALLEELSLIPAVPPTLERLEEADPGVEVEVRVTLWPSLETTPRYRDRQVEVSSPEVTDDEVDRNLDRMREQFASLETADRPAGVGDFVSIDIEAATDGEEVGDASARELLYEVGSGGLVEGIDARLEGMEAGQRLVVDSVLPAGFGERAGRPASFTLIVHEVKAKVLPELDDEWVSEVTEFSTVDELRNALAAQLGGIKRRAAVDHFRRRALENLVDETEVVLPEALIRKEMDDLLHRFVHRLQEREVTFEEYLRVTGLDQEVFLEDLRGQADRSIRTRLVLESVARAEGVEVAPEETSAVVELLAARARRPEQVRRALGGTLQEQALRGDILRNKALAAVIAGARPVDEQGNPLDLDEPVVEAEIEEAVEAEIVAVDNPPIEERM